MELCPAVVPCATTDGESGSSLKFETPCYSSTDFRKGFPKNKPLHKLTFFCKLNRNLVLDLPMHIILLYPPSVGVVGLAEYVCTHPTLTFYRGGSRLRARRRRVGLPFYTQPCLWNRPCRDASAVAVLRARGRPHVVCGLVLRRSLVNYYYYLYRVSSKVCTVLNHLL